MKKDMDVFLRTPECTSLHQGKLTGVWDGGFSVAFRSGSFEVEEGAEIFVFYDVKRRFMQQPVRAKAVSPGEEQLVLDFETLGDPASAEARETYRVSCYSADIVALLGDEGESCEVLDVSETGFAVFCKADYQIGRTLQATLCYGGESIDGTVVIQSVRVMGTRIRYGVRAVDDKRPNAVLQTALSRINLAIQREQAARLSGNL